MDLFDLKTKLVGWPIGTWFHVDGGWSSKRQPRPYVLAEHYTAERPVVRTHPRTTTGHSGLPHPAHPSAHETTCRIDEAGRIVLSVIWPLKSESLKGSYACEEPYAEVVEAIKAVSGRTS